MDVAPSQSGPLDIELAVLVDDAFEDAGVLLGQSRVEGRFAC